MTHAISGNIFLSQLRARTTIKNIVVILDHEITTNKSAFNDYDYECLVDFQESLQRISNFHKFHVKYLDDHPKVFEYLTSREPDFIINLVNYGYLRREKNNYFASFFEMLGIPFLNAGMIGITLSDNKNIVHRIAQNSHVPTPTQHILTTQDIDEQRPIPSDFPYPAFLKLRNGRGSCGITDDSIIISSVDLYHKFSKILEEYLSQSVLGLDKWILQEYLPGAEYNVTVLGNGNNIRVFPIIEISRGKNGYDRLFQTRSFKAGLKKDPAGVAHLSRKKKVQIQLYAKVMFQNLEARDYSRMEFRCDKNGTPKLIDVNPLSSYGKHETFALSANQAGLEYAQLWQEILYISWARYDLITFY